jgi:hypothetical protein
MAPTGKNNLSHNEEIRTSVLNRDRRVCQWPGCGDDHNVNVLFILETDSSQHKNPSLYSNGVTLCPNHMEIVNLHETTFGPLIVDLIRLVEFETDLEQNNKVVKEILKQ